jgi:thiazole synthase ThiGH ThiG subunit
VHHRLQPCPSYESRLMNGTGQLKGKVSKARAVRYAKTASIENYRAQEKPCNS